MKTRDASAEKFFAAYPSIRFAKGEVMLRADQPAPGIMYLKRGLVRMYLLSPKGDMFMLHLFEPRSFFLMTWLINDGINSFYFDALTDAEIARAPIAEVAEFFETNPELMYPFAKRLLHGVDGLLTRMQYLILEQSEIRVASLLVHFAKKYGRANENGLQIQLPLPHKDIASWIGTTRETASLIMEDFKQKGLISYRKRYIEINDMALLKEAAKRTSLRKTS